MECTIGEREGEYYRASCPDLAAKIRLLKRAAARDATDPRVQCIARAIPPTAAGLHAWVRDRVRFRPESVETFRGPCETIARGGDCDDHARLMLALAELLGLETYLAVREPTDTRDGHVCLLLRERGGEWKWAETTVDAQFGEHPMRAAERLGLVARSDLGAPAGTKTSLAIQPDVVVDPSGTGKPGSPRTYGEFLREINAAIKKKPIAFQNFLSPMAQVYQGMVDEGQSAAISALSSLMEQQQEAIADLADDLMSSMVRDLASDIIDVIPILGALINTIIDIAGIAGSGSPDGTATKTKLSCATDWYIAPSPSGATGIVPADIFAPVHPPTVAVVSGRSTLGQYLIWLTEDPLSLAQVYARVSGGGMLYLTTFLQPRMVYAISADDRKLFRWMRTAIESQYRTPATATVAAKGPASGTGGLELWPLYLELLLWQFANGKLNWEAAAGQWIGRDPICQMAGQQGEKSVRALLDGYARAVNPVYANDAQKLKENLPEVRPTVRAAVMAHVGKLATAEKLRPGKTPATGTPERAPQGTATAGALLTLASLAGVLAWWKLWRL